MRLPDPWNPIKPTDKHMNITAKTGLHSTTPTKIRNTDVPNAPKQINQI
jgi:hypothetical protein